MNKLIKAKIFELSKYLKDNDIKYLNVDVEDHTVRVLLSADMSIYCRSDFYAKHETFGITNNTFPKIIEHIRIIDNALDFEKSSLWVEKRKLNRLMSNVDKSFTDKTFQCRIERNASFGGYTETRRKITLYDPEQETISQYLNIVPGINYHEMGHVFFTPSFRRLKTKLKERYIKYDVNSGNYNDKEIDNMVGGMLQVVNMLEDGRIENLMTKKIGGCVHYFRRTITEFLLKSIMDRANADEKISEMDCVLIAGRKYIDGKVRRWIFDEYQKHEDNTHEKALRVSGYVNKFITLSWKFDKDEMLDLCIGFFLEFLKEDFEKQMKQYEQFSDMIKKALGNMGTELNRIGEDGEGDELSEEEQGLLKKVLKDLAKEGVEVKGSKGKNAKFDKKAKKKGKSDGKGKKQEKDRTCTEQRPEGPGDGDNSISGSEVQEILKETLKHDLDEINKRSMDLTQRLKSTDIEHNDNERYDVYTTDVDMNRDERKLEKYFKELKSYCRNGYKTRKRSGTVDIGEARRQEHKRGVKIFRQYKKNVEKALDIDVAFVLDCSYSMAGGNRGISKIHEASKQLWIASEACRKVGAKVQVFTFSDGDLGILPKSKKSSTYNVPNFVGGTTISESLYYAENYLNCSKSNTKWLISLTDGAICDVGEHNSLIERMQSTGITCGKINLTANSWDDDFDGQRLDIYDHSIYMVNGDTSGDNIVSFFKSIYEISAKKVIKLLG
jgi:hypothetical protein